MNVILAFTSRTQALRCGNILESHGVKNMVINTPEKLGIGCGLSVQISKQDVTIVKTVMLRQRFSSFKGFWIVKNNMYESI